MKALPVIAAMISGVDCVNRSILTRNVYDAVSVFFHSLENVQLEICSVSCLLYCNKMCSPNLRLYLSYGTGGRGHGKHTMYPTATLSKRSVGCDLERRLGSFKSVTK